MIPNILTIAGSDSGGGAGIQADLKTITMLGAYCMTAITALTSQNGLGVTGIHAPDADFTSLQLRTIRDGFPIAAAKTGMLFDKHIIEAVAKALEGRAFPLVVDPVCISQSGHQLLKEDAVNALKWYIIPHADLLTPNAPEAAILAEIPLHSHDDIPRVFERLFMLGPRAILIKGGHLGLQEGNQYIDWLAFADEAPIALLQPAVATPNNHGTGCTLSAAIATFLGFGLPLQEAIVKAQAFLHEALVHSYTPGLGTGPPNHAAQWLNRKTKAGS